MPTKVMKSRGRQEVSGAPTAPVEISKDQIYQDIEERRLKEWENYQRSHRSAEDQTTNRAYIDVSIGDTLVGRLVLELYEAQVPNTVHQFRRMLTGDAGIDRKSGMKLDYLHTAVWCIDKKRKLICCGDMGTNSIVQSFQDENFSLRHTERGLLTMLSSGPHTSKSCFALTMGPAPNLDFRQVVFGKVVDGLSVLDKLEVLPVNAVGRPLHLATIAFCGVLTGDRPPGCWQPLESDDEEHSEEADVAGTTQEEEPEEEHQEEQPVVAEASHSHSSHGAGEEAEARNEEEEGEEGSHQDAEEEPQCEESQGSHAAEEREDDEEAPREENSASNHSAIVQPEEQQEQREEEEGEEPCEEAEGSGTIRAEEVEEETEVVAEAPDALL